MVLCLIRVRVYHSEEGRGGGVVPYRLLVHVVAELLPILAGRRVAAVEAVPPAPRGPGVVSASIRGG